MRRGCPGQTHGCPVQLFVLGSCAGCTEFATEITPWPGLTRPSTSSDRRDVAKKDVGGRVKPGQGASVVVYKHHLATEFAEPDSRGLDPAIHVFRPTRRGPAGQAPGSG